MINMFCRECSRRDTAERFNALFVLLAHLILNYVYLFKIANYAKVRRLMFLIHSTLVEMHSVSVPCVLLLYDIWCW